MNHLTTTLFCSAALAALATAPAVSAHAPAFHVAALHRGHAVNKTKVHIPASGHITYTFGVSTSVSASDLGSFVRLAATFYKWSSYTDVCNNPRQKLKVLKKSLYGKIKDTTETYTAGDCQSIYYGDSYKLKKQSGIGQTDSFVSTLYGWFRGKNGSKYKGTLNLDISVAIENN